MHVRRLFAPLVAIAALAGTALPAAAGPHRGGMPHASTSSTWHVAPPATTFKHVQRTPQQAVFSPAYVPMYLPSWQNMGAGAFSTFGLNAMGFGLNRPGCQSALPPTLGDLGTAGAGRLFAPVAFASTPSFGVLPSTQTLLPQQQYCQAPALDLPTLNLGD